MLVTCIDIPVDAGPEAWQCQQRMDRTPHPPREQVVNACLQPPLNDFRELMYHEPQLG